MPHPDYTAQEICERGRELYEARLKDELDPEQRGRFVVMDVISGDYLVGDDHAELSRELQERRPGAPLYAKKIGYRAAGRLRSLRRAEPQRSAGVPPAPVS